MSSTGWPSNRRLTLARVVIRMVSSLVPAGRRGEWRQMWEADLWDLASSETRRGPRLPAFVAGTLPAALSELGAEWGAGALAADAARAWRRLRGAPLHAAFAVLIMVIGISANTSIFAIVNATLIRVPPHIADAERLVQLGRQKADGEFDYFSFPSYADIRDRAGVFSGVAAYGRATPLGRTPFGVVPLAIDAVTANFFDVLGVTPPVGRAFTAADEAARAAVAIISDARWRRDFAGTLDVIGRVWLLDGVPFTIVGVAPPGFIGADVAGATPDAWIPLQTYDARLSTASRIAERRFSWLSVVARLAPGVSRELARAAMETLHARLSREYPGAYGAGIAIVQGVGLRPDERTEAERVSLLLMSVVGVVLLIACANLAGLSATQAARRQRDLTVRAAFGASSLRLTRELLAEQIGIALTGAVGAWILTLWTARAVQSLLPYSLAVTIAPDWRVFVFAVTAATVTSLAFGLLPARRSARVDVSAGLREGPPAAGAVRRPRGWMAAAQLALSFALLIGAALLVRSLAHARAADPGFRVDAVAAVRLNLELVRRRSTDEAMRVAHQLLDAATAVPGIEQAALSSHPPLAGPQRTHSLLPPGAETPLERSSAAVLNAVSADYLSTMDLPLERGRGFTLLDAQSRAAPIALVSETTARRLWPDRDPVGQQLDIGGHREVVGVVADVKLRSLSDRNLAAVYIPLTGIPPSELTLLARTRGNPARAATELADLVRTSTPDVAVTAVGPMRELLGRTYGETQMVATLLLVFGGIAALLAAAGVYVVLASWVAERRRELAIRFALGATPGGLRRLVVRRVAVPAAGGLFAGSIIALVATRSLSTLLFGVTTLDPASYLAAAGVMLTVTLAAGYLPVRRAMHADPIVTLKGA